MGRIRAADRRAAEKVITGMGFPHVSAFQAAWNLGDRLEVDNILGPLTHAAAMVSRDRDAEGKSDLSAHFDSREFRCRCGGQLRGCEGLLVLRPLLTSLEKLRGAYYPRGLVIVSGYRCLHHNAAVDGAPGSQHIRGAAADIHGRVTLRKLRGRRWFAGLGYVKAGGFVTHVDRRDRSGHNPTGGSLSAPSTWPY
jgi:hypothetical protein